MIVEILIDIYLLVSSISVHFRKFSRNEIKLIKFKAMDSKKNLNDIHGRITYLHGRINKHKQNFFLLINRFEKL